MDCVHRTASASPRPRALPVVDWGSAPTWSMLRAISSRLAGTSASSILNTNFCALVGLATEVL